ncbi:kyphoscoliosis peptidase isoform 3 [Homo sapiens]|uniref:kyphoscoliosis peptidase isoform 3 n=1 Tax=Homo sapiens TaxID=9606 RepID=UPI000A192406|nr:kyphoscoliosis peptidase isoform 3 [Homo sapiens]|eukprot:NP_001337789.1 kyphoscoliosis peptidase isoform 3 [Homo sapiens]
MELKKDINAVSIDMLLIVHSEKRRAAQGTLSDQQANPSSLLQRGGGTQLTVEVHPRDAMPQLLKKFSLAKRLQGDKNGNTRPRQPGGKDAHAYPWDRSSLKSMSLDLQQFEKLDIYASQVTAKSGLDELVSDLLQEAHTDLERVRAIWIWICHHIEYDIAAAQEKDRQAFKPTDILRTQKTNCDGYAGLFERMCRLAGVQCMTVPGYSKGFGYQTGQSFSGEFDHAWNAVYLEGRWHLVDSTWGSGLVDTITSKFTFLYNEFYFLTHPALFIEDHFPDNKNWQLLKPPQSLRQFENNMYHKSEFYNKGMLSAHPETSMIRTGEPGAGASVLAAGMEHFALSSRSPPETALSRHALPDAWLVSLAQSLCVHVDEWRLLRQPRPSGQGRAIGHISRDKSSLTLA